jgi:hypothetical protein
MPSNVNASGALVQENVLLIPLRAVLNLRVPLVWSAACLVMI